MSSDKKTEAKPQQQDDYIPKPDRNKFMEQLQALRDELNTLRDELSKNRQHLDSVQQSQQQSPEETQLRAEHSNVLNERNVLRETENRIQAEAKKLEDSIRTKITEVQLLKPKNGPRSVKDVDTKIDVLEREIESGTLPIATERQHIKEVTALKNLRVSFAKAEKLQAEIDQVRQNAADVRKQIDAKAMRAIMARKAELEKQLDKFKEQRQATRSKLNSGYEARRASQAAIKEVSAKMDALRASFDAEMADFNAKLKARKHQREASEAEAKERASREKKLSQAEAKLAQAKEPAYAAQIEKAQRLLEYFEPSSAGGAESAVGASPSSTPSPEGQKSSSVSQALNAPQASGKALTPAAKGPPPSRKSLKKKAQGAGAQQSLSLDIGIIDALSSLNISLPSKPEQIEATKTQLKEKIEFYKENNDRVTKERVERAEQDLEKVKAELEKTSAKSAKAEPDSKAEPEA